MVWRLAQAACRTGQLGDFPERSVRAHGWAPGVPARQSHADSAQSLVDVRRLADGYPCLRACGCMCGDSRGRPTLSYRCERRRPAGPNGEVMDEWGNIILQRELHLLPKLLWSSTDSAVRGRLDCAATGRRP